MAENHAHTTGDKPIIVVWILSFYQRGIFIIIIALHCENTMGLRSRLLLTVLYEALISFYVASYLMTMISFPYFNYTVTVQ